MRNLRYCRTAELCPRFLWQADSHAHFQRTLWCLDDDVLAVNADRVGVEVDEDRRALRLAGEQIKAATVERTFNTAIFDIASVA
jgi:hypothetical protein